MKQLKPLLICLFVTMIFFGCEEEKPPPFSKEKMQEILIQIHLTDAAVSSLLQETKDSMSVVYLEQVKEINKITDADIESIFAYLKEHPIVAEEIYGSMITEVSKLQVPTEKK